MREIQLFRAGNVLSVEGFKQGQNFTTEQVIDLLHKIGHQLCNGARYVVVSEVEPTQGHKP